MKVRIARTSRGTRTTGSVGERTPAQRQPDRQNSRAPATVPEQGYSFADVSVFEPQSENDRAPDVERLLETATAGPAQPLPYRSQIESRLGQSLGHVEAYSGPDARAALDELGADAASTGNKVVFAEDRPQIATVAHEVTHVLQSSAGNDVLADHIAYPDSAAELEAEQVALDFVTAPEGSAAEAIDISGQLDPGSVALQRSSSALTAPEGSTAVLDRSPSRPAQPQPSLQPEPAATPDAEGAAAAREALGESSSGAGGEEQSELELTPAPEPGITAEDVAAREAALAEAEAVLAAAQDVPELMGGFATSPPTVKAMQQGQIGEQVSTVASQESDQFQQDLPDFHATLNGEVEPAEPIAVSSPESRDLTLEENAPPPAPEPDIPDTPDPGHFEANAGITRALDLLFGGEQTDKADQVDDSLRDVQTTDPDIPRTPGPPPTVPLEGENDPERLTNQADEGVAGAKLARDDAHSAVLTGPGPEQSQPVKLDESYTVEALNTPATGPVAPAEGAQAYLDMGLPPEVQTAFDQQQQQAMQASMDGAVTEAQTAAAVRDESRATEVQTAETQATELSDGADEKQRDHVRDARATIQTERQATLDAQSSAVSDMEGDVEVRRETDRGAIDTRVTDDQKLIEDEYTATETGIDKEIKGGESDAEAKRIKAEEDAANQSWWDRAVNFVKSAFNALVSAINSIFDAVRSAINGLLDLVKDFANKLIDAAASFIKSAIGAFGEFLKFAVDGLLGDIFPGLAAKLTSAIDDAVTSAQGFVDDVAEGLKAGINALVEGLRAGLNKILDTFQAGINVALAVLEAALTGDWGALARKLLEAVLLVIGVAPESFYAFIGRAEETFQMILDDPLGFLGSLVDSFIGGVQLFADNILTHLQTGVIGWLTGTLGSAGITLPATFDLMGVLHLAQQILGLTWDRLRQKAVKLIGEENVARLEHIFSYIETLVTEGWAGLWERIKSDLGTLRDTVLDGIKSYIMERVILAAITKIASLFNPVGAIVQLVLAAWNLFSFLKDKMQRIFQVVQSVIDAIGDIARGILDPAKAKVEQTLASLLPLALDLIARLLGLGDVGARVREVVEGIRATVDKAIDSLIQRVLAAFQGKGENKEVKPSTEPVAGAEAIDAADHTAVAGQVVGQLQQVKVAGPYETVRAHVLQRATELETYWSGRLEPGIGLKVAFAAVAEDQSDRDVDFEVVIAPNTIRSKGSVPAEERAAIRLEGDTLVIDDNTRFAVGAQIQVARGRGWIREPHFITRLETQTIGGEPRIMVSFDTDPPSQASTVSAETYPKQWRKPIESLQGLPQAQLDVENARPQSYGWSSDTTAKWVLNYRAHNVQHVNPRGMEWEHIVEEATGGAHSADNLALAEGDLNRRLGTYYGTVRRYPELALEDITDPIILREYLRGKSANVQRKWKLKVYGSPDFRVSLSWQNQGRGPYQVLE